ncbi:transcriptional regulator [cyanobacterium TDX16]|nr:transcriptional regulator [cyanobacterium TDX16]
MNRSIMNLNLNDRQYPLPELAPKVEYALLALLELAAHLDRKTPLTMSEMTAKQPIPERYLEQILTDLRRGGLIKSHRGAKGGYSLVREPWQVTLLEVVTLMEGDRREREYSAEQTVEKNLLIEIWQQANVASHRVLSSYTLQDLCQQRDVLKQTNPMYYI